LQRVFVDMRGKTFSRGYIEENDWVELPGPRRQKQDKPVKPKELFNLTKGTVLKVQPFTWWGHQASYLSLSYRSGPRAGTEVCGMRYSQARSEARPSKRSSPRQAASSVSWSRSSASRREPRIR
jgi:hypothetical protein